MWTKAASRGLIAASALAFGVAPSGLARTAPDDPATVLGAEDEPEVTYAHCDALSENRDTFETVELSGIIGEIRYVKACKGLGDWVVLTLNPTDAGGEATDVYVAPSGWLDHYNIHFNVGDGVIVEAVVEDDDQVDSAVSAVRVMQGDTIWVLRDAVGAPYWRGWRAWRDLDVPSPGPIPREGRKTGPLL
jgi:hypothetical protein